MQSNTKAIDVIIQRRPWSHYMENMAYIKLENVKGVPRASMYNKFAVSLVGKYIVNKGNFDESRLDEKYIQGQATSRETNAVRYLLYGDLLLNSYLKYLVN
ncbi:hypothetical protein RF11_00417 [Thelohanellus kitauei]|uniref:Uncharacterized protein n=1 Tax=Thelohanellus kitauei TaxID=669202 RepID=A0A0C2IMW6_THEKT|nr:hypothetical protein RF11_00417 [Thelohanellus kitauei]